MNDQANTHPNRMPVFLVVFLMLCGLTGLSIWIANSQLMDDKATGWIAMISVALAKAILVVSFFMHLWWEGKWKYIMTLPAMTMAVLLVILLVPDVGMRTNTYSKDRSSAAPIPSPDFGNNLKAKKNTSE